MKILFVCTGNTCRSPMAEGILNFFAQNEDLDLRADSMGIFARRGDSASFNAIRAMEEIGLDIGGHRARPLDPLALETYDLILAMGQSHKEAIKSLGLGGLRLYTLLEYLGRDERDIVDPYGGNLEIYRRTRDEIYKNIEEMIKHGG